MIKGGSYVPNNSTNSTVPTGLPIRLTNFYGSANTVTVTVTWYHYYGEANNPLGDNTYLIEIISNISANDAYTQWCTAIGNQIGETRVWVWDSRSMEGSATSTTGDPINTTNYSSITKYYLSTWPVLWSTASGLSTTHP